MTSPTGIKFFSLSDQTGIFLWFSSPIPVNLKSCDRLAMFACYLCPLMKRQERILLFLLATINFTHILDFMIMMPLGNFLMPHFDISAQYFSLIVAAYPVTAFVSGMIAAFYVDKYDRKKVLLFAYTGFIIGTITCGIASTAFLLMAARVLTGLFGGLIGAQVLSIIADTFPYEKRGQAMATVFMAFSMASVFGVPFSLYLAKLISWHAPFIFIGILGIVLLPFFAEIFAFYIWSFKAC